MGEVMMRGDVVMRGYLKNAKATEATFAGGWLHSGDLGRLMGLRVRPKRLTAVAGNRGHAGDIRFQPVEVDDEGRRIEVVEVHNNLPGAAIRTTVTPQC